MKAIKRAISAAMLAIVVSLVAGCYAYVDDGYYHRHSDYRRDYYRDYPYRHYSYRYRDYDRW